MDAAAVASTGVGQAIQTANTKKRKQREKKIRDPNAPKKPLTAAFLFAQNARSVVKKDLEEALGPGEVIEKNAVQLEVNKRWNELSDDQKEASTLLCPWLDAPYLTSPSNGRRRIATR